jgi:two-component system sensor histidine kinase CpxA
LVHLLKQMASAFVFRFSAGLLASGVVCFLLIRYLTSPIRKLQSAVRRFSLGNLTVRVAPKLGSRQDEIADLGRDFDIMAARIETLMHAHERLLRDAAHELRSPLTRLNVALEIARKHSDDQMLGFLDRISIEAQKLSRLITQVLSLSRLENIDVELRMEPVCLEKLIDRIVQDANFEGQNQDTTISFKREQPVTFKADGQLMHSAIENVVRNALRFSPAGSAVEIVQSVEIHEARSMAVVTVSDSGPGVPPEVLTELFKPFFRVAGKQERSSNGAGIGLAIANRAVNLHHGTISAVNRSNGGLKVEIRLPLD